MAEIVLNSENFDKEVLESDIPVLVDFWATWCGPCRMVAPVVAQIAEEFEGRVKVGKIDVDDQPELARRYMVMSIPTLIVFKDGAEAERRTGFRPKGDLVGMLSDWL